MIEFLYFHSEFHKSDVKLFLTKLKLNVYVVTFNETVKKYKKLIHSKNSLNVKYMKIFMYVF